MVCSGNIWQKNCTGPPLLPSRATTLYGVPPKYRATRGSVNFAYLTLRERGLPDTADRQRAALFTSGSRGRDCESIVTCLSDDAFKFLKTPSFEGVATNGSVGGVSPLKGGGP